ncbi:MAG: carboxypeptidase regulatory-like domain-containing protein [Pseudomonadota bacterium]
MKIMNYLLIPVFVLVLGSGTSLAHKVNLFAYAEGGRIYTESYFPDGKAVETGKVLVYDSRDKLILEGVTDQKGLFQFVIPKVDDLTIVIDASMGHKNSFKLKKSEVEAGK